MVINLKDNCFNVKLTDNEIKNQLILNIVN